ncbi:coiled-coil domain-containing protein 186-like isoform X2 [Stegodyphus dumicola]|uniref:coiled-coil domain-containing protein 186-like isoform X2 n=1 Tax=Stegodyphus dumicola TaxID=202533 RepID=UPI0015AE9436|nr:coiled-coil domain-containing protein 186-like isoform X2 [Stegodyphus dumicola]
MADLKDVNENASESNINYETVYHSMVESVANNEDTEKVPSCDNDFKIFNLNDQSCNPPFSEQINSIHSTSLQTVRCQAESLHVISNLPNTNSEETCVTSFHSCCNENTQLSNGQTSVNSNDVSPKLKADSESENNLSCSDLVISTYSDEEISPEKDVKEDFSLESGDLVPFVPRCELKILESKNSDLQREILELKMKLNTQEIAFKKYESEIRAEFLSNIEKLSKECNTLRKEKEAIVVRYANSEKEVLKEKKIQQDLEKKLKDMIEIAKLQKQNEKLNADINSRDTKIKWLQNKLKNVSSAHEETQVKLEHTVQRLNEMREEAEQVRKDCQEMIKCYQEAEEIKSVKLDSQLKQKLSELEVQKQEKSDQEQVYHLLRQELEALKKKQRMTMEENNSLTLKIQCLEKERLEYEQTLSKLKDSQNLLKQEVVDLTARLAEMESLRIQLEREREKLAASLREVERLRLMNAELQADMDACHAREGELLEFTERTTAKTVKLQSDQCLLEIKAQALEDELSEVKKQLSDVQQKYLQLTLEFEATRKEHEEEVLLLARKLAEQTKNVGNLNTRLDEAENENRVLKRRHITSIKELSRELYQCKKRLENYESSNCIRSDSASLGSRTSSTASLDMASHENKRNFSPVSPSVTFSNTKGTSDNQKISVETPVELDKERLIEKVIKLQKTLAKRNDKIEFLEDHIEQLVKEMKKRSKFVDLKTV